jgi:hypothetical protein
MGRDAIIPFANVLSSNRPFNSPLAALIEQWIAAVLIVVLPPPGDAYAFIANSKSSFSSA